VTGGQGPGSLAGCRVIELAHIMAGPVCGLMLADMGADVIKVEKPDGGDDTRRMLPPDVNGESAAFMMMNRNKRGIALDLKHPAGRRCCWAARRRRRGDRELPQGHDGEAGPRLRDAGGRNPGLIYCEISGFGRSGPYADRGGFDLIAQGMSA
jgi:crotonobetainyl-CoA:carnitine CoA-transferase CaiB-like acyl-CoA transferase